MNLLLPKKLSSLSPKQIVDLLSPIKTVEGPIYTEVMIPTDQLAQELGRQPPVLFLMGDFHSGTGKCQPNCNTGQGCYSLYTPSTLMRFVDSLAKKHSISTDFFSEVWVSEKDKIGFATRKNTIEGAGGHNSALLDIISESVNCTSRVTTFCPFPHLRTHLSDPRKIVDGKYTAELLCDTLKYLEKIDIDIYRSFLEKTYPGFTSEYLIELMSRIYGSNMTIGDIFDEPFYQQYSRTYHEWVQLPESIRLHIRNRNLSIIDPVNVILKIDFKPIYSANRNFFQSLQSDIYIKNANPFLNRNSSRPYSQIEVSFVDIYTISRALKTFKGGLPSQLSVIFLGATHINNIKELMGPYYQSVYTYGTPFDFLNEKHRQMGVSHTVPKCNHKNEIELDAPPLSPRRGPKTPPRRRRSGGRTTRKPSPKRGLKTSPKRRRSGGRTTRKPSPKRK